MKHRKNATAINLSLIVLLILCLGSVSPAAEPSYDMPASIEASARYLVFYHNYYVEKNGPDGDCKYFDILKTNQGLSLEEIALESSAGHRLFFKPSEVWVEPAMTWLKHN